MTDLGDLPPGDEIPPAAQPLLPHAPHRVAGDRGAGWIVEGWDCFKAATVPWLMLSVLWLALLLVVEYSVLLGAVHSLLKPVWAAGFLMACHAQYRGERVDPRALFAGFTRRFGSLVLVGVLQFCLYVAVLALFLGPVFVDLVSALFPDRTLLDLDLQEELPAALASLSPQELMLLIDPSALALRVLLLLLVLLPLLAAFWFAPALLLLGDCSLGDALRLSLRGTLRNVWPFLIYGFCGALLALLVPITLGAALLVLVPVYYLSLYLSYRDIFID